MGYLTREIHACGFNAHEQLQQADSRSYGPSDLRSFQKITAGDANLGVKYVGWSTTLFRTATSFSLHGHFLTPGAITPGRTLSPQPLVADITTVFGNTDGILGCLTKAGQLCIAQIDEEGHPTFHPQGSNDSIKISHLAIDGAGRIAIVLSPPTPTPITPSPSIPEPLSVYEFPSLADLLTWFFDPMGTFDLSTPENRANPYLQPSSSRMRKQPNRFTLQGTAKQLQAGATFFALLLVSGELFTWGDARHHHCLGRTPSALQPASSAPTSTSASASPAYPAAPANTPGLVDSLDGVPIAKISCGGWITAALSHDRDLYLLGRSPPGQAQPRLAALPDPLANEHMRLVDIDGVLDVVDAGAGTGHVIVLAESSSGDGGTPARRLFAIGDNANGQLGLGEEAKGFASEWVEVPVRVPKGVIREVHCGPLNTFLLVEK